MFVKLTRILPEGGECPILLNPDGVVWVEYWDSEVTVMCQNGPEVIIKEPFGLVVRLLGGE